MKKIKRVVILCMFLSLLCGCSGTGKDAESVESTQETTISIGICFDTFVIERWERDRDVFVSTANELGAEVDVQNPNGSVDAQIEALEYFIEKNVDVIVVVPIESEPLTDVICKAREKGIKVIAYDRLVTSAMVDLYISFDNERVGTIMATSLEKELSAEDQVVMICGPQTDHNVNEVSAGFEKEMAAAGITVADKIYLKEWKGELAYTYVNENIDLIRECQAIMCGNDNIASQVIFALSENRLVGDIYVTGQDADLEACQRIVEGTQYMTVYKPVNSLAEQAARSAVDLAKGEELIYDDKIANDIGEVPYIKLSPQEVTAENMDRIIIDSGFHSQEGVYRTTKD